MDESVQMTHQLNDVLPILSAAPFTWAIGGGWAIDLHLGEPGRRPHGDVDVVCLLADADLVRIHFSGWDLHRVVDGDLEPWQAKLGPATQVWARPSPDAGWAFELLFERVVDGLWPFRRNRNVTLPVADLSTDIGGIPVLALGPTLLYKAKRDDDRDLDDLRAVVSFMTDADRRWLAAAVADTHGLEHRWVDELTS